MKLELENYEASRKMLPGSGQQIVAQCTEDELVVYQAYKPSTAKYSVEHQELGGPEFSYNRMSWIKPNFLWMMFRCGWAEKKDQEHVLAIWLKKTALIEILENVVTTNFDLSHHTDMDKWKEDLKTKQVQLQWDPDHDPFGNKLTRRAMQLGLKRQMLRNFGKTYISRIEDITPFVKEQKQLLDNGKLSELIVPVERVWKIGNPELEHRIRIDHGNDNTL
ncbi:MAG: DUF4291 domain-containing protein [Citrobacter freundii]|nr:MAG: DUF4291 domain-containing protein [Citrobacter freundii]